MFYEAPKLEQAMTEQMMLKLLTQMDVPFVLKMKRSFQDRDALYITTVSVYVLPWYTPKPSYT